MEIDILRILTQQLHGNKFYSDLGEDFPLDKNNGIGQHFGLHRGLILAFVQRLIKSWF